jgi:hypothetical protein
MEEAPVTDGRGTITSNIRNNARRQRYPRLAMRRFASRVSIVSKWRTSARGSCWRRTGSRSAGRKPNG